MLVTSMPDLQDALFLGPGLASNACHSSCIGTERCWISWSEPQQSELGVKPAEERQGVIPGCCSVRPRLSKLGLDPEICVRAVPASHRIHPPQRGINITKLVTQHLPAPKPAAASKSSIDSHRIQLEGTAKAADCVQGSKPVGSLGRQTRKTCTRLCGTVVE